MNLADIGIVFGIVMSLGTVGGTGAKYYMDHEYVPISALLERDARELRGEIRDLEYDQEHGGLSEKDSWLLQQLYDDLDEIEAELQ